MKVEQIPTHLVVISEPSQLMPMAKDGVGNMDTTSKTHSYEISGYATGADMDCVQITAQDNSGALVTVVVPFHTTAKLAKAMIGNTQTFRANAGTVSFNWIPQI